MPSLSKTDRLIADHWRNFVGEHIGDPAFLRSPEGIGAFIATPDAAKLFRLRNISFIQALDLANARAAKKAQAAPFQGLLFGNDPNERLPVAGSHQRIERCAMTVTQLAGSIEIREARWLKKIEDKTARVATLTDPAIEADKKLVATMKPYAKSQPDLTVQGYLALAASVAPAKTRLEHHA